MWLGPTNFQNQIILFGPNSWSKVNFNLRGIVEIYENVLKYLDIILEYLKLSYAVYV
jgi:hypothetical protein